MTWLLRLFWLLLLETTGDPPDAPEGDDEPTEEEIKNPRTKELSHEAGRWRKKFRAAEERIRELEERSTDPADLRTAHLEGAFWRELAIGEHRIADHESAWDLFTAGGFADLVNEDVSNLGEALEKLLARYPWLSDDDSPSDADVEVPGRRSAPPPRKRKDPSGMKTSRAALDERFPALRRHAR